MSKLVNSPIYIYEIVRPVKVVIRRSNKTYFYRFSVRIVSTDWLSLWSPDFYGFIIFERVKKLGGHKKCYE